MDRDENLVYDENGFVIDCKDLDRVDWSCISKFQKLTESFIEKFQDKVSWYWISACQKLTEGFIEKFQDKVYWYCISRYQKLQYHRLYQRQQVLHHFS